ncbi:MAG: S9 family peptidase [Muribaculaceae bacterium]|nr:S9 family peptidase [Muribaculaceae bacterium]
MKLAQVTTMLATVALLGAGCGEQGGSGSSKLIEKPQVTVENGQFTPEVLNAFGRVSDAQVSPDGKKILYGISYVSVEENKSNRELWVMDIDGQNAKQLTKTANSESNAVWMDGGNKIAFVYKDDKEGAVPQMWVMDADGGGRKCVSDMENGIEGFVLSPDEKSVVLISTVKYGKTAQDHHPDLDKTKARIIDDLMYKHWNEWVTEIPHPFVGTFDGSKVSDLKDMLEGTQFESPMRPWGGVEQLAWMPDSKSVIYVCRKKVGKEYAISTNSDLYRYTLADGKTENLTEGMMGYDNNPVVSKSGKIAWLSMEHDGYEADKNRIFMMDANGGNKVDLSANWDYSVDALFWSPDEKYLYFICPFQGTMPIFRMEVATQKIDTIAAGQYDYDGLAFAGDQFVTLRHSYLEPNEVFAFKAGEEPKQLSHVNDELLGQLAKVECRKVMVPTTDGKQMTTWVLLPPGFDESKKYPAILFCEGGPQSPVSQFWSYRWNLRIMANHGYVVIAPNRRGLPGFGTEWNAQISGDYGGQNMKDYMSAVDYMKKEPWIDGEHIGATGASYGGFSVYWLAGNHQKRFAAFLAHAGIFNLMGQYLETEELWFVNWDLGGPYWDKSNAVAQKSYSVGNPANYVQNWDTPIMCTTGDNDFRIVYTQTMQAFNAAKLRGLPARMVLFPDEDHWCQKPQNSVLWQREFFKWFDSWLMPESEAFKARVAAEAGEAQSADSTATK